MIQFALQKQSIVTLPRTAQSANQKIMGSCRQRAGHWVQVVH
jgi:hypothetical protein